MALKLSIRKLKHIAEANTFTADLLLSFSGCTLALALIISLCPTSVINRENKDFSRSLIPLCLAGIAMGIPWRIGAKHFKKEIDEDLETNSPCRRCKYYSHEAQAKAFLLHPCALHPQGKPDTECRDWDLA
ncbi:hypothetical protein ACQ4M3_20680 [Leptolyngbya sp. AN03gr2]|uniref:hypothetical protein n=1 Tax=unclassified Leptolyngbya TaxID=2650499 RepID=UPI003D316B6E